MFRQKLNMSEIDFTDQNNTFIGWSCTHWCVLRQVEVVSVRLKGAADGFFPNLSVTSY